MMSPAPGELDLSVSAQTMFAAIDVDRNGYLSPEEVRQALAGFGQTLVQEALEQMSSLARLGGTGGDINQAQFEAGLMPILQRFRQLQEERSSRLRKKRERRKAGLNTAATELVTRIITEVQSELYESTGMVTPRISTEAQSEPNEKNTQELEPATGESKETRKTPQRQNPLTLMSSHEQEQEKEQLPHGKARLRPALRSPKQQRAAQDSHHSSTTELEAQEDKAQPGRGAQQKRGGEDRVERDVMLLHMTEDEFTEHLQQSKAASLSSSPSAKVCFCVYPTAYVQTGVCTSTVRIKQYTDVTIYTPAHTYTHKTGTLCRIPASACVLKRANRGTAAGQRHRACRKYRK